MNWNKLIYIYVYFSFLLNFCICINHVINDTFKNYLNERFEYASEELISWLQKRSNDKDIQINVLFYPNKIIKLPYEQDTANVLSMFNNIYAFIGNKKYDIFPKNNTFNFKEDTQFSELQQNISFIKAILHNNLTIMLICYSSDHCPIYGKFNNTKEWFTIQSVFTRIPASDAIFFINKSNLYLIISKSMENVLGKIIVYKWTGNYFDMIDEIMVQYIYSISSFQSQKLEVIVTLQNSSIHGKHNIVVYQFNNDHLQKLQLISTEISRHLISYVYRERHYIAVFEENSNSSLYWWNGYELMSVNEFYTFERIQKLMLSYIEKIPIIFIINKDHLLTFLPSSNKIQLYSEMKLNYNYDKILDMIITLNNNKTVLLIFTLTTKDKSIQVVSTPFRININEIKVEETKNQILQQCLIDLNNHLKKNEEKLNLLLKNRKKIVQVVEIAKNKGAINTAMAQAQTVNISIKITAEQNQKEVVKLKDRLNNFENTLVKLNSKLNNLHEENLVCGNLFINGTLRVDSITTNNLNVVNLNDLLWLSNTWLSYSKSQTIGGDVLLHNLKVKNIVINATNIFGNVENNETKNILHSVSADSLTANNIYTKTINNILFEDIYLRKNPVRINDVKKFNNLTVYEIKNEHNKINNSDILQSKHPQFSKLQFSFNINIKNFNFQEINGIVWNIFKDSTFHIGVTKRITGNLFGLSVTSNALFANKIHNINSNTLLTTSTNQNINSTIHFSNIKALHVLCQTINNIDLRNAITHENNFITGPVIINNMYILKTLLINGSLNRVSSKLTKDHIIGTDETNLLIIYNKVIITGKLQLSNVFVSNSSVIIINGKRYTNDIVYEQYWSKNHNQVIPVFFEAVNGVKVPDLRTNTLNDVAFSSYMLNTLEDKAFTNLLFKNISILGNIKINRAVKHVSNLHKLDLESIKISGNYHITSCKTLQGNLTIKHLIINYIDDINLEDVVNIDTTRNILGTTIFENLIVKQNIESDNILTETINGITLKTIEEETIYLDKLEFIEALKFKNFKVHNLHVSSINAHNFHEFKKYFDNNDTSNILENVVINGQLHVNNVQNLNYINNYEVKELFDLSYKQGENVILHNSITFLRNVYIKNINVLYINNVNFENLVSRLLYKNWDQNITEPYVFDNLHTPNIFVPHINNIHTSNLINIKNQDLQNLVVVGGLQLISPKFTKSLHSKLLLCKLKNAIYNLQNPPTDYWNIIHAFQNVKLWDDYCSLNSILDKSVNLKKANIITGQVTFQHHISSKNVHLLNLLNGIDLNEIVNDAVIKNVEEQKISGNKKFTKLITLNCIIEQGAHIPLINNIDIEKVNLSIIFKNNIYTSIIRGSKLFYGGLQTNSLLSNTLSDLNPEDLVSLNNLETIPNAFFNFLKIDNDFNLMFVNSINFSDIMSQRLLQNSLETQFAMGVYYFSKVEFFNKVNTSTINYISIDQIVIDDATEFIFNKKMFSNTVIINGNIIVELFNKQNLSEIYHNSIILENSTTIIKGNIKFRGFSISNIETENINGISTTYLQNHLQTKLYSTNTELIYANAQKMESIIDVSKHIISEMSSWYLYLEKLNELKISASNILNSYILQLQNEIMLNIIQKRPASNCGLPDTCNCPIQETVLINPVQFTTTFTEISDQRVFNYEDEKISIYLFTNSISTSEVCRSNNSTNWNETTSIMWMTYSPNKSKNRNVRSDYITGYISAVKFFKHNGNIYMIVSRFYDPEGNTYNMDCLIYKFFSQMDDIKLIQKIKTYKAWTLHLFDTQQGTVLIIGNMFDSEEMNYNFGTDIYRFNETLEQFIIKQKIPSYISTIVVGVTMGADSLIILSQKDAPLYVLKYQSEYDNYYFYQSIFLDSPVIDLSIFYIGDFGTKDPFLCVVTSTHTFYIYSFQDIQGWFTVSSGEISGLQSMVPFVFNQKQYIFAISSQHSFILTAVKHGSKLLH